jgi:hypothetical protein
VTLAALLHAQRPTDVVGWSTTHWGMTEREVISAFANKLTKTSESKPPFIVYSLPGLVIEGANFFALLVLEKDRLIRVKILPERKEPSKIDFEALEAGLTSKYGAPTYSGHDEMIEERRWIFPTTVIYLSFANLELIHKKAIDVTYEPNDKKPPL